MDTIDLLKNHFCDFFGDNTFDPTKTITTFQDVCNIAKVNIEHYILPKTATKNDIRDNAYDKLKLIISVFNQGWEPNYYDNCAKYYPNFDFDREIGAFSYYHVSSVYYTSTIGANLFMKECMVAEYVAKTFIDIYNEYLL